jgi:2-C-methyl-D-erythritol 4-phosphate cytidylyltransferase
LKNQGLGPLVQSRHRPFSPANIVPRYVALVPAAGTGSRVGEGTPKQYLELAGRPLLQHTLATLAAHPSIVRVFVVLAPGDERFHAMPARVMAQPVDPLYCGGETRAASVYNGLVAIRDAVSGDDWVLVHDAARPCVSAAAIDRLIAEAGDGDAGGLLALPVADTLKRQDADGRIAATQAREGLWQAQTPQMFRYGLLVEALRRAGTAEVTDEAGAIEHIGLKPRLVMGEARNVKVTYSEDLALAELILRNA